MTTVDYLLRGVLPAAFALLPAKMSSPEATAMLLAIALQESGCKHRVQIGGPAHGFWQFEKGGGVEEVLTNRTSPLLHALCRDVFRYPPTSTEIYVAMTHNDVLAAVCARLLLYTFPTALPMRNQPDLGWAQYRATWRPGKPHPDTWPAHFQTAWVAVGGP